MTTTLLPVVQNGIQSYLASIRRIPVLSAEEEYMLANRFRDHGDLTAAKKLISAHLRLAAKIAFSYRFYGLPLEDLISEANIGLMQAVKRFEPDKGNRFIDLCGLVDQGCGQRIYIKILVAGSDRHDRGAETFVLQSAQDQSAAGAVRRYIFGRRQHQRNIGKPERFRRRRHRDGYAFKRRRFAEHACI